MFPWKFMEKYISSIVETGKFFSRDISFIPEYNCFTMRAIVLTVCLSVCLTFFLSLMFFFLFFFANRHTHYIYISVTCLFLFLFYPFNSCPLPRNFSSHNCDLLFLLHLFHSVLLGYVGNIILNIQIIEMVMAGMFFIITLFNQAWCLSYPLQ